MNIPGEGLCFELLYFFPRNESNQPRYARLHRWDVLPTFAASLGLLCMNSTGNPKHHAILFDTFLLN